jgi:plastocyanin
VVVSVREFAFSPKSVQVEPGQTVVWQLEGDMRNHNVIALDGRFSGFLPDANSSFRQTFTEADRDRTFEYRCSTHQACCSMQGSVRVGANAPPPDAGY